MKRTFVNRRVLVSSAVILIAAASGSGCGHLGRVKARTESKLEEHSRALTTAVVDTLQSQPEERRDSQTQLALQLAREDQRIEGLPLEPIAIEPLLHPVPDPERRSAERQLEQRFATIEQLLRTERRVSERLERLGEVHEREQNASLWRRWKWGGGLSLVCGGLIALLVFFPAAAPWLGRIIAWLVGKIPSLAGALGVVSVKAFDAVVKGIERSREQKTDSSRISNAEGPRLSSQDLDALEWNLSREMDASHKALVRARKAALQ